MIWRRIALELAVGIAFVAVVVADAAPPMPSPQASLGAWWTAAGLLAGLTLFAVLARELPRLPESAPERRRVRTAAVAYVSVRAAYEELLWRRFLLAALLLVAHPLLALAASLIPWVAAHRPPALAAAAAYAITGATFGGLLWASGGLLAPLAAHASYNLAVCAGIERARTASP